LDGEIENNFIHNYQAVAIDEKFYGADLAGGIGLFTEPETKFDVIIWKPADPDDDC